MTNFKIKTYGKSELAMLYFPTSNSYHSAVNHLMAWIRRNTELTGKLEETGYKKSAKYFTPKEVALVVEYLGEP